jgi:hypothetical protein
VPCIRKKGQAIGPEASSNLCDEEQRGENQDKAEPGFAALSKRRVTVVMVMIIVHEGYTYGGLKKT